MCVFISQAIDVEYIANSHIERRQRFIFIIVRYIIDAVLKLPQIPHSVDHAVVRPENGIKSGDSYLSHVATAPSMNLVVYVLELGVEIDVVPKIHQSADVG